MKISRNTPSSSLPFLRKSRGRYCSEAKGSHSAKTNESQSPCLLPTRAKSMNPRSTSVPMSSTRTRSPICTILLRSFRQVQEVFLTLPLRSSALPFLRYEFISLRSLPHRPSEESFAGLSSRTLRRFHIPVILEVECGGLLLNLLD